MRLNHVRVGISQLTMFWHQDYFCIDSSLAACLKCAAQNCLRRFIDGGLLDQKLVGDNPII